MKDYYKIFYFILVFFFATSNIYADEINKQRFCLKNGPTKSQRIVIAHPPTIGLIYICGLSNRIIGCPMKSMGINIDRKLDRFYSSISPNLANAVDIGVNVNYETLLSLKPDLVVTSSIISMYGSLNEMLDNSKIPYIAIPTMDGSLEDWFESIKIIGEATNRLEKTNKYMEYYKKCQILVESRVKNIPLEKRPKVALINTHGGNMILRGSRTKFFRNLMKIAGARILEDGDDPSSFSKCAEILFEFEPEIIIDDSRSNEFYNTEWFKQLKPVKEGRIYKTPQDDKQSWITNWSQPTYSCLGLLWMAKIFHPELFKDIDIEKEHKYFYETFIKMSEER